MRVGGRRDPRGGADLTNNRVSAESVDPVEDRTLLAGGAAQAPEPPLEFRVVNHEDALRVLSLTLDPRPQRLPSAVMSPPRIATASLTRNPQSSSRATRVPSATLVGPTLCRLEQTPGVACREPRADVLVCRSPAG